MRPRSFGEILDGAFQIYRRHAPVLALTTLLPYGVRTLLTLGLLQGVATSGPDANPLLFGSLFVPIWIVGMCAVVAAWGALTWEASEALIGGPVKLGEAYRVSGRSFFRLLGTLFFGGILLYIGILPGVFVGAIGAGVMGAMMGGAAGGTGAGIAVAIFVAIMVVGMVLGVIAVGGWLSCAIPLTVIEGIGPFRAIGRSFDLARGSVLRCGSLLLVAGLIVTLPIIGLLLVSGQLTGMFTNPGAPVPLSSMLIQQLGGLVASAFTTPFLLAVMTVLYYDRRVRTEALDEQLVAHELGTAAEAAGL
jgi:hypothetical protein